MQSRASPCAAGVQHRRDDRISDRALRVCQRLQDAVAERANVQQCAYLQHATCCETAAFCPDRLQAMGHPGLDHVSKTLDSALAGSCAWTAKARLASHS